MDNVYRAIFSFSGGYNYPHGWVCSQFRFLAPKVSALAYLDVLCRDKRKPEGLQLNKKMAEQAIKEGLLYLVMECKDKLDEYASVEAARYGHLEILKWSETANTSPYHWGVNLCYEAIKGGHLHVLQWLVENDYPCDELVFSFAIHGDHFHILEWLVKKNVLPLTKNAFNAALFSGGFKYLLWLKENGCPWDEWICVHAVQARNLEFLKWLRENGCPWDEETCAFAAQDGNLEILQWARSNGCPWNEDTCTRAASKGHLEILKWAHANGCPWNKYTYQRAKEAGRLRVTRWLTEQGLDGN
ncbi:ankyrin repeat [Cedratvirus lausannensis]|uniref:Ankyrin repeat n=1 Tax=Cedratvirus lausannensis TaxID=2023205 RepID=A0A285PWZ2_9VIRU|nr:ankyrin repeat [Cedratvirus lausannensis]